MLSSKIIFGDAYQHISTLPDNLFRLVLADPPYVVSRKNNYKTIARKGVDFGKWDHEFDQLTWTTLVTPKLVKGGSLIIWNDWKKLGPIAEHLSSLGLSVKRFLTWRKTNPSPFNMDRVFLQGTEHALWAVKPGKWIFNGSYHTGVFDHSVQHSSHPNKKPDKIFEELITLLTNENDWVLDPFCGSGTTAIACKKLNRNYICMENDPAYFDLAMDAMNAPKSPNK